MIGRGQGRHGRLPSAVASYRLALRAAGGAGAKAYGFTLVIWTTGALAIAEQGVLRAVDALAYLAGSLLGMGLIVVVCFGGLRATWGDIPLVRRAYGAIHVVSVVAGVLAGWLLAALLEGSLAFLAASFAAVVVYHLLLALEVALSIAAVDNLGVRGATAAPDDESESAEAEEDRRESRLAGDEPSSQPRLLAVNQRCLCPRRQRTRSARALRGVAGKLALELVGPVRLPEEKVEIEKVVPG